MNNTMIEQIKETVLLGVIMDENINWKTEISHVANKVSNSIRMIHKSSSVLFIVKQLTFIAPLIHLFIRPTSFTAT